MQAVSQTEQFILIGTECIGYRAKVPGLYLDYQGTRVKNDRFIVDYVRVFDKA